MRLPLFELEDLAWFPRTIRDFATDYLHFMEEHFALHKPVVPLLRDLIARSGATQIVDLCSGGGGPARAIYESPLAAGFKVRIILTAKFPNTQAFSRLAALYPDDISYRPDAIDATNVPRDLAGLRTVFNAFHHFDPQAARAVLESAVGARQPIGIYEIPERRLLVMAPFLFTPLYVALATPFIRPFRWKRLLFTYVIPLIPLTCWWDGLISAWRAYTVAELLELARDLQGYDWTAGQVEIRKRLGHVTYLEGTPHATGS